MVDQVAVAQVNGGSSGRRSGSGGSIKWQEIR